MHSGTPIGLYAISVSIGVGGMGEVFRAHMRLNRDVASKGCPKEFANHADARSRVTHHSKCRSQGRRAGVKRDSSQSAASAGGHRATLFGKAIRAPLSKGERSGVRTRSVKWLGITDRERHCGRDAEDVSR